MRFGSPKRKEKRLQCFLGVSSMMLGDCLTFTDVLPIQDLDRPLAPGSYRVEMTLAGYPEVTAATSLTVVP